MQQMNIPEELSIPFNYEGADVPAVISELRPQLFHDGEDYCCLLGPDIQSGIYGCGISTEDALRDWQQNLTKRITQPDESDEVALYAIDVLNASNRKVW